MATKGTKGFIAEENLRAYFLWLGYYVLRGVKLKKSHVDLTDIDLLLVGRTSPLSRERINVDSKNKKIPQAAERVFFAKGIQSLLGYERCIVATSSTSSHVCKFAEEHEVSFLDGDFLKKLSSYADKYDRISEDELIQSLKLDRGGKTVNNYVDAYETSKTRIAFQIDFSTISELLLDCRFFVENMIKDYSYNKQLCRCFYAVASLFLVALDYVNKDLVVLSESEREKRISDGFVFGSLGKEGSSAFIDKAFAVVKPFTRIDDTEIVFAKKAVEDAYSKAESRILIEFFSKSSEIKDLFKNSRELEQIAFSVKFVSPQEVPPHIRSILFILLDYFKIDRNKLVCQFK